METKSITIQVPEGICIDEEKSTFEKIVFKPIDSKPRSWEEYCDNFKGIFYYIQDNRDNIASSFTSAGLISKYKNYVPSKEYAEAFLAMMQLMSLRQTWIGDWKPDWENSGIKKYCICCESQISVIESWITASHPLSFPTYEMALEFKDCFKDLLEQAKPLI